MFDMVSIYILIAGSYTPFTLIVLKDDGGWILFSLIWFLALVGVIWKVFTVGKYNLVSVMLYMFMGGLWLFFIDAFINEIPPNALKWIYVSCFTYLIGVFFYLAYFCSFCKCFSLHRNLLLHLILLVWCK